MSDSYLNKTGLSYFWSKLKAWANGLFVHLSGDETINGVKTFTGSLVRSDNVSVNLAIFRNPYYTRGTVPSNSVYSSISFVDANGNEWDEITVGNHGRLGTLECAAAADGSTFIRIAAWKNETGTNTGSDLRAGIDANGILYSESPSTSLSRNSGKDILTRDWIPKDTRIVHTTRDETVDGVKTFMRGFVQKDGSYERGVSTEYHQNNLCYFYDKNDVTYGLITCVVNADKSGGIRMYAYDTTATSGNNIGYLGIGCTSSGNVETYAPTSAYTADYYQLATTKWVRRYNRMVCYYAKTINKPYTLIATTASRIDSNFSDLSITLLVDRPYANGFGGCGICQINLRTDDAGQSEPAYCQFTWLARTGDIGDCIRIGLINTPGNAACDIYFHNTTEYRTGMITVLSQSANRYNNPNQYHPTAGFHTFCSETDDNNTRSYSTMDAGAQALWGENYTTTYTVGTERYLPLSSSGNIVLKKDNVTRGTAPSSVVSIDFLDIRDSSSTNRISDFNFTYNTNKSSFTAINAYNTTSATGNSIGSLAIGCDSSGNVYTKAPTPPANDNSTQIATTAWVRSHTHGNMLYLQGNDIAKGSNPSSTRYWAVYACDKNGTAYQANAFGIIEVSLNSTGDTSSYVRALSNNSGNMNSCTIGASYKTSSSYGYVFCTGSLEPASGKTCGTSSAKWSAVWATNGTIQTSDERVKTNIDAIPEYVLDAWENVQWKQFKMKDSVKEKGDKARLHTGIIAQQIQKEFEDKNIDVTKYGFFCWDEWGDSEAILDADGNVVLEAVKADEQYSVRYDEALVLEAAYMRRENARLKKRVADLEDRLAALELRLGSE